ncbi:MAG TPA: hypothetical protein VLI39_05270, partial [Sedimentisphaerales bacterium]|nr:hypothetical protein [Sedimentisphaerales bacterium]
MGAYEVGYGIGQGMNGTALIVVGAELGRRCQRLWCHFIVDEDLALRRQIGIMVLAFLGRY